MADASPIADPSAPPIQLLNVYKRFGALVVLDDVSLDFPRGKTTAVIGPSGTGKSVLLKHIVGLLHPDAGEVRVLGVDMARASDRKVYAVRKRLGMLFQDGALLVEMSGAGAGACPRVRHREGLGRRARAERGAAVLEVLELPGRYDRATSALSGGQRKRVGLARAIVNEPEIVLFDEPNSGLDPITSDAIDALIHSMRERLGITFVVISHDIVGTLNVADRIAMLFQGKLIANGTTDEVTHSDHPMVRRFLSRNLILPAPGEPGIATLPRVG